MNKLFYGDNLDVLREHIASESVDLIYLDPPFNSNANYNMLFKDKSGKRVDAQIEAFGDTWQWGNSAEDAFDQVMASARTGASEMLRAMRGFLGDNDMMAYLAMMAVRLIELHRVLRPTGSMYLHCDPTASHYLKVLVDAVFDPRNYLNEIIWRRTGSHNNARRFGPIHDIIHFVRKSDRYHHRPVFRPYTNTHVDGYFKKSDHNGRFWTNSIHGKGLRNPEKASGMPWRGYDPAKANRHWAVPNDLVEMFGIDPDLPQHAKLDALADLGVIDFPAQDGSSLPTYRQYLDRSPGVLLQDLWAYQPGTKGVLYQSDEAIDEDVRWLVAQGDEERLGYETQKPVGLLERILRASSDEGQVVLDPFCGCGTTVHAAQRLNRSWLGIDITHVAIKEIEKRLNAAFPGIQYEVHGTPRDLASAQDLAARDKHQFELWALAQVDAVPWKGGRKGADTGIDGIIYFKPDGKRTEKAIVEVKGGGTGVKDIGRLAQVMDREKAELGVLVTAQLPTSAMIKDAAAVGRFTDEWGRTYPKLQILTLAELFQGKKPDIPFVDPSSIKRARREDEDARKQGKLI